jgi:hypothetical protein
MNVHLKKQKAFFSHQCRHPAFLFSTCEAASGADSSVMPNELPSLLFQPPNKPLSTAFYN